jgi:hypothetical protein
MDEVRNQEKRATTRDRPYHGRIGLSSGFVDASKVF